MILLLNVKKIKKIEDKQLEIFKYKRFEDNLKNIHFVGWG